jgi:microcystin-dependent protein
VLLLVEGVFFYSLSGRCVLSYPNDELMDRLDAVVSDAAVASAALGTIASGSDAVVDNFAGLQDLVDALSSFATTLKSGAYYAPVGLIAPFGGVSGQVPSGWLLCAGQAVSQSTYADLYAVVGANAFGTDGGGNFYLPDLRGRVVAGIDNMGGTDAGRLSLSNTMGTAGGAETLPAHTHTFTTSSDGQTAFQYAINQYAAGSGSAFTINVQSQAGGYIGGSFATANAHTHSGTTASTGTGTHGVVQPTMVLNYLIKA